VRAWLKETVWPGVVEYIDPVLAAVAGIALSILALFDVVGEKALLRSAVAILALLSLSLVRERRSRSDQSERLDESIAEATQAVQESVRALETGDAYRAVTTHMRWDIQSPELARSTKWKTIEFLRSKVATVSEFRAGDGEVETQECFGALEGGYERRLSEAGTVRDSTRDYQMYSLGEFHDRGQRYKLRMERTLRDAFTDDHEEISMLVRDPGDQAVLEIVWPAEKPPRSLRFTHERGNATKDQRSVFEEVKTNEAGRPQITLRVSAIRLGDLLFLAWDW
jgi:hypothetical protein